jgi:hypothetical protein
MPNEFYLNLEREIKDISRRLEMIKDTLYKIDKAIIDESITVGSRVLINWEQIPPSSEEGRVEKMKPDGSFIVQKDKGGLITVGINHANIAKHSIKNLSVGTYGKLEKEKWLLTMKLNKLKQQVHPLRKVISFSTAKTIVDSSGFEYWYKANGLNNAVSYEQFKNSPEIFVCGIVKEYLNSSENDVIEIV